ncbi:MAG: NUDIX domain-containing protein [Clostridia bacterium]|nr:NUDIX domain-containing protein [Clostridia bacterium]
MKYEKSCGAIVLRRDKTDPRRRFLLVIRQYKNGPVSFPKGHVEPGESERETAAREVLEETAARINITGDFRETISYSPAKGVNKDVVYFLAETSDELVSPHEAEIAEAFWIDVLEAELILGHDNDRQVFRLAMEYIEKNKDVILSPAL